MNVSRAVIRQFATRQFTTSNVVRAKGEIHPGFFKLKDVQAKFQQPDGKPVFLKGGPMDQVLYRLTMLLCLGGLGGITKLFWDLSVPKTE